MSPVEGESNGEIVVVGEDSVEPEVIDETLSRCTEGKRRREFVLTGTWAGTWRGWIECSSSLYRAGNPPYTDINDGNESGKDSGLVCTGMIWATSREAYGKGRVPFHLCSREERGSCTKLEEHSHRKTE
jgi:hypothetical protein